MTTSITHLDDQIVFEGKTLSSCSKSMINHCYRGEGDHTFGGNYGSLKLLDQVLKIIERVVDSIIRSLVKIDELQFGFQPVRKTTNAIFILRQINQKHFAKNKLLHFAFVDLKKTFDRVSRKILWQAMWKPGIEERLFRLVQAMYSGA